jgi:TerC family integral membrane protein
MKKQNLTREEQMQAQAEHVGTEIVSDTITEVRLKDKPIWLKGDSGQEYTCDALIICTGAQAKWLDLPSEQAFRGFGVSACATCDGFFYRNKRVVVVGGGNTAVEEALFLTNFASEVIVVHRRNEFKAERILQNRLFNHPKIKVMWDSALDDVLGTDNPKGVTHARIRNVKTGETQDVAVDGIFIAIGATLIAQFSWIFWIFGAFLIYTAIHQAVRSNQEEEETENKLIAWLRKRISITEKYNGIKLRTTVTVTEGGKSVAKRMLTPMLLVLISLAVTDVIFAFDSIPAIFGITTSPFIVFVANVFALMGLRQLYFLLGGLIRKLHYLTYGIAVILAFIGVKLVLHALHENALPFVNGGKPIYAVPEISTEVSLIVIVASIAISALASVWKMRRDARTSV